ncbi:MAG: type II toxin-antitoxin system RelE/ParE family toxin [Proteobacteria bacterium]|nr:type II toxin-antitoxin system RelE/ParE family toxin [Pseudomonadota bacterium]
MARLRLSRAADDDLAGIRRYSETEHGAEAADSYLRSFNNAFARLREHPKLGRQRLGLPRGIRGLSCGRHILIYRYAGDEIFVVRVVHQAMDVRAVDLPDLQ